MMANYSLSLGRQSWLGTGGMVNEQIERITMIPHT